MKSTAEPPTWRQLLLTAFEGFCYGVELGCLMGVSFWGVIGLLCLLLVWWGHA